jgi:cellulose synthase/poly-beta-1,6-N-acetylglucosamine synthase-like glycosyltransferase
MILNFVKILIYLSIYLGLVATTFFVLSHKKDKNVKKLLFKDDELPTVSVVIPAWNEERSIARTLRSVLKSDYPKELFEVIVIDDGSKDKTYQIAKKFQSKNVRIFTKENGGKGTALNFALKKCKGEIIFSMDADTFIKPNSIKEMTRYFKNSQVMLVSPSMLIHKPKGILQRIQQAEYLFGIFIRKAFASVNAIHVTPGAFSAYRKTFFDKYGGYDEGNITEDLELALRIQYNGYKIEYSPESTAYTIAPNKFKPLMIQRRRWYTGLMKNTWKYKKIISRKYGDLGIFIIPLAWISIFFSVFAINYMAIKLLLDIKKELLFLRMANFDFSGIYSLNKYTIESFIFGLLSNPVVVFLLFFVFVLGGYMIYATKKTGKVRGLLMTILIYFLTFAVLFGFWWMVSIIYTVFNRKVKWR